MKKKLLIVGALFLILVLLDVFSSGHGHVVVVEDNIHLNSENKHLIQANKFLSNSVSWLKKENKQLEKDKKTLKTKISEVAEDLDSTKTVVKKIKKALKHEQTVNSISNGSEFEFQPIKLPDSEGN